jgi:CelD/BcsL family acetyltransferase involved in cellulose biosynthesis
MTAAHWQSWTQFQSADRAVENPFFSPEFTHGIAAVRPDVEIAVIRNDGEIAGFLPLQRDGRHSHPVCGRLSEFHGVIARQGADWSPSDLVKACGLASWRFDHLPDAQTQFAQFIWGHKPSPYMDLGAGFAAYRELQRKAGSTLSQTERKARKLEREVGPLRLEWHTGARDVMDSLIAWKTAQYQRTKRLAIFRHAWVGNMLRELQSIKSPTFQAPMSALYAGDKLLAVHQGITSPTVLHIWFPAYSIEFESYSPGLVLLLKLAEAAAGRGIRRVDFGPGEERYKQCFKSGDLLMAQGYVSHNRLATGLRNAWYGAKVQIRRSPFRPVLEAPLNASRRLRQWLTFK